MKLLKSVLCIFITVILCVGCGKSEENVSTMEKIQERLKNMETY